MTNDNARMPVTPVTPQGRLTLVSEVPVLPTTVSASSVIYYIPAVGNAVSLFIGEGWQNLPIGVGLSNHLDAAPVNNAGPDVCAADKNYDLFAWYDDGEIRLTRGPAWTGNNGRGAGDDTTELVRVDGILVNAVAITNGPHARLGTYLGTFRTDESGGTVSWCLGGYAEGGVAGRLHVWNYYNRIVYSAQVVDTTYSWAYQGPPRPSNDSVLNRVSWVYGVSEDAIEGRFHLAARFDGTVTPQHIHTHLVPDEVTADVDEGDFHRSFVVTPAQFQTLPPTVYDEHPTAGYHFLQTVEDSHEVETLFFGDHHFRLVVKGRF